MAKKWGSTRKLEAFWDTILRTRMTRSSSFRRPNLPRTCYNSQWPTWLYSNAFYQRNAAPTQALEVDKWLWRSKHMWEQVHQRLWPGDLFWRLMEWNQQTMWLHSIKKKIKCPCYVPVHTKGISFLRRYCSCWLCIGCTQNGTDPSALQTKPIGLF